MTPRQDDRQALLTELGFRFGDNGPHAARTMMLEDLRVLFAEVPAEAAREAYADAVVQRNLLSKPTRKARELALRHLAALYGLDPRFPVFRALRRYWAVDLAAQPVLALTAALARDPLLRSTRDLVLGKEPGAAAPREEAEALLGATHPDRFSPASLKSFAQNVLGTWTAAGFLSGRARKTRAAPAIRPANVAFCLFLGFLEGRSGQRLFSSAWMRLIGLPAEEIEAQATAASHRGLLVFMNAGGVKELRFPGFLTPQEEQLHLEVSRVV